jgi:hypothetical protein
LQSSIDSGANWHAFRIDIDYSFSDAFAASFAGLKTKYLMAQRLFDSTKYYFQNNTQVFYKDTLKFPGGTCFNELLPKFEKSADLVVVFSTENTAELNYTVASTACFLSEIDDRPVIGSMIFNFAYFQFGAVQEFYYFSNFAHEFTHILGFSHHLFHKFVMPGTLDKRTDVWSHITIGDRKFPAITMKEVVNFASEYFGCKTIEGLPLETSNDPLFPENPGSHWEKMFLPQEFMGPTDEIAGLITDFSLTFLRATGWYKIKAKAAEPYTSGKGAGCSRFGICPAHSSDYCTKEQETGTVCSPNWMSKSNCVRDTRFDNSCFLKKQRIQTCATTNLFQTEYLESYGPESRCLEFVEEGASKAKCLQVVCNDNNVVATVGQDKVVCTPGEKGVEKPVGSRLHMVCPDPALFCSHLEKKCPDDCSRNGICRGDKKCWCFAGWKGESCHLKMNENELPVEELSASASLEAAVTNDGTTPAETKKHSHLSFNVLYGGLLTLALILCH